MQHTLETKGIQIYRYVCFTKCLIALQWKNISKPRTTFVAKGKYKAFEEVWSPFISYLKYFDIDNLMDPEDDPNE